MVKKNAKMGQGDRAGVNTIGEAGGGKKTKVVNVLIHIQVGKQRGIKGGQGGEMYDKRQQEQGAGGQLGLTWQRGATRSFSDAFSITRGG
jgi:hypothetical protein